MSYTKGPWHVGGINQCTIYDRTCQRIANSFEGVMVSQRSDDECQANARIIAAAPEMHEALIFAMKAMNEVVEEMTVGDRFTNAGQYILDALDPVRAAIAKAKGEVK